MKRNSRRVFVDEMVDFAIGKRYFGGRARKVRSGRPPREKKRITFAHLCTSGIQFGNYEKRFSTTSPGQDAMHRRKDRHTAAMPRGLQEGEGGKMCRVHPARFVRVRMSNVECRIWSENTLNPVRSPFSAYLI